MKINLPWLAKGASEHAHAWPGPSATVHPRQPSERDTREPRAGRHGERRARFAAGEPPAFLGETAHIRASEWTVAPLPPDLLDRRVEITGPVERKMIINALNSGASVFMAAFQG